MDAKMPGTARGKKGNRTQPGRERKEKTRESPGSFQGARKSTD